MGSSDGRNFNGIWRTFSPSTDELISRKWFIDGLSHAWAAAKIVKRNLNTEAFAILMMDDRILRGRDVVSDQLKFHRNMCVKSHLKVCFLVKLGWGRIPKENKPMCVKSLINEQAYLNSNLNNNDLEIDIHFSLGRSWAAQCGARRKAQNKKVKTLLESRVMRNEFPLSAFLIKSNISYLNCIDYSKIN